MGQFFASRTCAQQDSPHKEKVVQRCEIIIIILKSLRYTEKVG